MNDNDKEIEMTEEMPEEENFAELLRESLVKPARFSPGQKVKTRIVKISAEWVFLDLGGKSEGYLDKKELLDAEGTLSVKENDVIEAYFLSSENNELRFTTRISGGDAARNFIEEAWRNGIPLEGLVEREIKGGFEIKIAGGMRGFCPYSQMGLQRTGSSADLIGQHVLFRITQFGERGRNIVLSNRAILEEERQKQREEQKKSLYEGMTVKGTITSIQNFGAFVKIGILEGLIPISEISWDRVDDINEYVQVGTEVDVKIMKLDWEKDRLSFSLRQALPDPWDSVDSAFPIGSSHNGTVVRLTNFGAFVKLAPGIDGLLHISKLSMGKRINHPREILSVGHKLEVKIDSIDKDAKRLSLSLAGSEQADDTGDSAVYTDYIKNKPESMGTLADLFKAKSSGKKK